MERGVQYVRERFFKGGDFDGLAHLREEAARWCRDIAGRRIHGTTRRQPLAVFLAEERQALASRDGEPYETTHWRTVKVHPDHHAACQYALYSVPLSLCSPWQQVEVGQQAGAHLSPGQADQDPPPPASRRPGHGPCRLPRGANPLHATGPGQDQAQCCGARTGGGRIRRPSL